MAVTSKGARIGVILGFLLALLLQFACASAPSQDESSTGEEAPVVDDSASENGTGRLEPRYQPREPVPDPWYNSSYIFGMTRGVANSTMAAGVKAPLFVLTVPLDIAFLPFTLIGGLFG